ncbi:Abi-alpha family protein [Marinobacter nauticus]|tara:strand:+ start:43 stop:738 length:696 start_codon:yes stop_codon:yes gene_type:complete
MTSCDDSAKAVEETAKAVRSGFETTQMLGGFVARLIGAPLEQAMGIWEDKLKYRRWENQLRLMDSFQRELSRRGLTSPNRVIPPKFAVPVLEAAAFEEDDYLRQFWAMMLVNAADETVDVQMRNAFVSILEDLTSLDVKVLEVLYSFHGGSPIESVLNRGFYIGFLPHRASPALDFEEMPPASPEVEISVANLIRLGLLAEMRSVDGGIEPYSVSKTTLGAEFFRSCTAPT